MSEETPSNSPAPVASPPVAAEGRAALPGWVALLLFVLTALSAMAGFVAWQSQQRVQALEQELVRRQSSSGAEAAEARVLAKQAQDVSRDAAAKVALVEARVAEVAVQRSQLEELMQSLSRSRDENLVTDIDSAIRVALQQTSLTGSVEPLVAALRTADERLARVNQPRLEGVRRAIARDLDRLRGVGVPDIGTLTIRLDEATRLVDDLPLLSVAAANAQGGAAGAGAAVVRKADARIPSRRGGEPAQAPEPAPSASQAEAEQTLIPRSWLAWWPKTVRPAADVWQEVRSLVRVTRIDQPEAILIAPEQRYFLRENLKLHLLNARLAVLSRQFDSAQSDLQESAHALSRYFDTGSPKTQAALQIVRQAAAQARQVTVPRPDDTFAALATAAAGR